MKTNGTKNERKIWQDAYFEELFAVYWREILSYIKDRTTNLDDAEDIFQNVFTRLCRKIAKTDKPIKNPRSYLYTLARFAKIDFYRGKHPEEDIEEQSDLPAPAKPENFLAEKVESIMECCLIAPALSPRQQIGLRMHVKGGLSQTDIAEFLEVSRQVVRTDLKKGYRILRAYYELEGINLEFVHAG